MRKIICMTFMLVLSALPTVSCAGTGNKQQKENSSMKTAISGKKSLVVFFSHTGENYGVGNIKKGNTHIIAEMIGDAAGASLFEIVPQKSYPHDSYDAVVEIARKEKDTHARPVIKGDIKVEDYDVIFIGYPNWWGDMPMPVYTFIERHDWKDKTVIPFCTHEGSGLSKTETYIADACRGATVGKGLAIKGTTAQNNQEQARKLVAAWLEKLK
ncbi:MAG: flavodoxin [Bacteroides sp.]|nr:flavodoxin [Roseburia sp.]MCM1346958.1 flavodoxin [Bacteroides sp.]MCM1421496.1 flavodoxin [Bacteroides sp.]